MDRNYVILVVLVMGIIMGSAMYNDYTKTQCRVAAINNHLTAAAVVDLCK